MTRMATLPRWRRTCSLVLGGSGRKSLPDVSGSSASPRHLPPPRFPAVTEISGAELCGCIGGLCRHLEPCSVEWWECWIDNRWLNLTWSSSTDAGLIIRRPVGNFDWIEVAIGVFWTGSRCHYKWHSKFWNGTATSFWNTHRSTRLVRDVTHQAETRVGRPHCHLWTTAACSRQTQTDLNGRSASSSSSLLLSILLFDGVDFVPDWIRPPAPSGSKEEHE